MSYSPYIDFTCAQWHQFRKDTPLTLSEEELSGLRGENETVSLREVEEVYLPLSRLLNLYIAATQELHRATGEFLEHPAPKMPYVIGVTGSVGVGKSTTSRILQALLGRWPNHPNVDIVNTDGFLYPNALLEQRELMQRKGFPESYDNNHLMAFLADLKAGKPHLKVPIYSHRHYDILFNKFNLINQPDIVIVEGVNILQIDSGHFFDFTLYVDAPTPIVKSWYIQRFMLFRERAKQDPGAFFHRFAHLSEQAAQTFAESVWTDINEKNLQQHILPLRERASLILRKGEDHAVENVRLRKL